MTEDLLLGQQLDEYRLEALLGRGGMARVYRGLDVRLKRYAAIKVIDPPFRDSSEYVRRFEREAQAIARLEHPHIVRLYRYGEAQGVLYMAMQYIEPDHSRSVPCPGLRAQQRGHPPRHQTVEHHARPPGAGLRH
jgi:serine/threonine protein kinase